MIRSHDKNRALLKQIEGVDDPRGKRGRPLALATTGLFTFGFVMFGILAATEAPIASAKVVEEATITFQITCPIKSTTSGKHAKDFLGTDWEKHIRFPWRYVMRENGAIGPEYNENGAKKNREMPLAVHRCMIPECAFYCQDLKTGFGESLDGNLDAAARDAPPRVQIMHLVNSQLHPRVIHVRPAIDPFAIIIPGLDGQALADSNTYEATLGSLPPTTKESGHSFWFAGSTVRFLDVHKVPFPIVLRETPKLKAFVIPRHYASVSGDDGMISIKGLPANVPIKFRFFHPDIGHDFVGTKLGDQSVDKDGYVTIELKPGLNDFRDVYIDAAVERSLTIAEK